MSSCFFDLALFVILLHAFEQAGRMIANFYYSSRRFRIFSLHLFSALIVLYVFPFFHTHSGHHCCNSLPAQKVITGTDNCPACYFQILVLTGADVFSQELAVSQTVSQWTHAVENPLPMHPFCLRACAHAPPSFYATH